MEQGIQAVGKGLRFPTLENLSSILQIVKQTLIKGIYEDTN